MFNIVSTLRRVSLGQYQQNSKIHQNYKKNIPAVKRFIVPCLRENTHNHDGIFNFWFGTALSGLAISATPPKYSPG